MPFVFRCYRRLLERNYIANKWVQLNRNSLYLPLKLLEKSDLRN